MMQEKELAHHNAGSFAWFAAKDARQRSLSNASLFTDAQKAKAERVKFALELVYSCERVTVDYCKKWVRIKVHKGTIKDKKNLRLLENDWATQGIAKIATPQGIIYRVL